ncbi:hypothetical protein CHELA20_53138 [Hyphomicrobiales bacterium]|nr:hypothetical protein CHELA41_21787 [Hyphomicrobiales bacterium]CAH1683650.1 hypothetical protein CHELA20_53138 [Hyphomicrobiales bacterium]
MKRANGELGISRIDQHRELDLRCGDRADVDALLGQRLECSRRDAGVAAHTDADGRNLDHIGRALERRKADLRPRGLEDALGSLEIRRSHRKGDIRGGGIVRNHLDDHVHIDVGFGQWHEDRRRDAGLVGHAPQGDLGLVLGIGDTRDHVTFQDILLIADERAGFRIERIIEARTYECPDLLGHGEFHGPNLQDLRAQGREFKHFLERHTVETARMRHDPRIRRVNAIHVRINVAPVRPDGSGNGHRARVRTAPPERGDAARGFMHALKPGDDGHFLPLVEMADDAGAVDARDSGDPVRAIRQDGNLPPHPGARGHPHLLQDDGKEACGDLFARGDHGIILARVMQRRRFAAPADELVGFPRHGRYDDSNIMPGVGLAFDMASDVTDAIDVGDGSAAEFHYEASHDRICNFSVDRNVCDASRRWPRYGCSTKGAYT